MGDLREGRLPPVRGNFVAVRFLVSPRSARILHPGGGGKKANFGDTGEGEGGLQPAHRPSHSSVLPLGCATGGHPPPGFPCNDSKPANKFRESDVWSPQASNARVVFWTLHPSPSYRITSPRNCTQGGGARFVGFYQPRDGFFGGCATSFRRKTFPKSNPIPPSPPPPGALGQDYSYEIR